MWMLCHQIWTDSLPPWCSRCLLYMVASPPLWSLGGCFATVLGWDGCFATVLLLRCSVVEILLSSGCLFMVVIVGGCFVLGGCAAVVVLLRGCLTTGCVSLPAAIAAVWFFLQVPLSCWRGRVARLHPPPPHPSCFFCSSCLSVRGCVRLCLC
jgi:hypothetical protein